VPEAVAEHEPNAPSAPPAGTAIENVMLLPETVPETVPVAFAPVLVSVTVIAPENDVPDWVTDHVMRPGPEESVAVPAHDPFTSADDVDGADGDGLEGEGDVVVELPPPPHAAAISAALRSEAQAARPTSRVRIMMKPGGF
jgi:hypothetical protein